MPLRIKAEALAKEKDLLSILLPIAKEIQGRRSHPYYTYEPDSSKDRNQASFHSSDAMVRLIKGGNQCTSLDTPIWTARGILPAGEVEVGDRIQGGVVIRRWLSPTPVPAWGLDFEGGFWIVANSEHPLWTESGWKTVEELQEGDGVQVASGFPDSQGPIDGVDEDDAFFAGLMVGDGCLSHREGVMSFTSADDELIEWVRSYVERRAGATAREESRGDNRAKEIRWCSSALKELWAHRFGGSLETARLKSIPRAMTTSLDLVRGFLRGYTAADGCAHAPASQKDRAIIWVSASETLLRETQLLLTGFGVYSTLSHIPKKKGFGGEFSQWRLRARGPEADRFMHRVGIGLQRKSAWEHEPPQEKPRFVKLREKIYCHHKFVVGFTVEPKNEYAPGGLRSHNSGKSKCAAHELAWILAGDHPYQDVPEAAQVYVISAKYQTLAQGIWRHLKEILPYWEIEKVGPRVSQAQEDLPAWIKMRSGAMAQFVSASGGEEAREKVQAAELDFIFIDEEVSDPVWEELQARRLARGGRVCISATLIRSEPWLVELEGRVEKGDKDVFMCRLETSAAVRAGHVSKKVYQEMWNSLSPEERQVRLKGRSRASFGLVYQEFSEKHIVDPFDIPANWSRYCALDPGWRVFAVLWAAVSPDGKYVLYRELYEHGRTHKEISDMIFAAEGYARNHQKDIWEFVPGTTEKIEVHWIDPSAFGHHESGEPKIGNILAGEYGLSCVPARNDIDVGIEACKLSLMFDADGLPRCRVFSSCESFLRERRTYRRRRDSRDPMKNERNEGPIKRGDHLMDTWRYLELGGLEHQRKPSAFEVVEDERMPKIDCSDNMRERFEQHWKDLMRRQRGRKTSRYQHVAGIGSEF